LTDGSEKPLGEWNRMEIQCQRKEIQVRVNGVVVNHGFDWTATGGKIALQAEGAEGEIRKIDLTPLEGR
jgi:Domain of Unknown Function (DUF1080)